MLYYMFYHLFVNMLTLSCICIPFIMDIYLSPAMPMFKEIDQKASEKY